MQVNHEKCGPEKTKDQEKEGGANLQKGDQPVPDFSMGILQTNFKKNLVRLQSNPLMLFLGDVTLRANKEVDWAYPVYSSH